MTCPLQQRGWPSEALPLALASWANGRAVATRTGPLHRDARRETMQFLPSYSPRHRCHNRPATSSKSNDLFRDGGSTLSGTPLPPSHHLLMTVRSRSVGPSPPPPPSTQQQTGTTAAPQRARPAATRRPCPAAPARPAAVRPCCPVKCTNNSVANHGASAAGQSPTECHKQ